MEFGAILLVILNWIELNWTRYAIAISLIIVANKLSRIHDRLGTIDNAIWHSKYKNPNHSGIAQQMSDEFKQERVKELSRLQQQAKAKDRADTVWIVIGAAIVIAGLMAVVYNIFN